MELAKSIKLIIFDLDGTLVDLPVSWEALKQQAGKQENQSFGERVEELIKAGDAETLDVITKHEVASLDSAKIDTDTAHIFYQLGSEYKLAILTRNSRLVAERFLQLCAVAPEQLFIVGREDVLRLKPHPEGLKLILDHFQVKPHETVLVGDTSHDAELAQSADLFFVLVGSKTQIGLSNKAFQADNLRDAVRVIHNIDKEVP